MAGLADVLFETSRFSPHGFCLSWEPGVLLIHILANLGVAGAYLSTAVVILVFARRRRDLDFPWMFNAFAMVFALCGLVHLSDLIVIWEPVYAQQGVLKAATAVSSLLTTGLAWWLLPRALRLPGPQDLRLINRRLEAEIAEHRATEVELRAAKDRAELASRAKSDFLATMSHELRTPLNAVIGFSEVLGVETFGPLNDRQREYVGHVVGSAGHLLELINDILDISKIDAGRLDLFWEPVDLPSVIESGLTLVKSRAEAREVMLFTEVAGDLPWLKADSFRLKQILVNILSNAVKFTPAGGRVVVEARPDRAAGEVILAVRDTGIGMAPEDIPRALEMFTQIGNAMTRRYEGTGIGLPLAKALVELHGGRLEIDSRPGEGTLVTIRLPIAAAAPASQETSLEAS